MDTQQQIHNEYAYEHEKTYQQGYEAAEKQHQAAIEEYRQWLQRAEEYHGDKMSIAYHDALNHLNGLFPPQQIQEIKKLQEHDVVLVGERKGTIVHIYNEISCEVEFELPDGSSDVELHPIADLKTV